MELVVDKHEKSEFILHPISYRKVLVCPLPRQFPLESVKLNCEMPEIMVGFPRTYPLSIKFEELYNYRNGY